MFSYDTVDVGMKDIYAHPATARTAQLQALCILPTSPTLGDVAGWERHRLHKRLLQTPSRFVSPQGTEGRSGRDYTQYIAPSGLLRDLPIERPRAALRIVQWKPQKAFCIFMHTQIFTDLLKIKPIVISLCAIYRIIPRDPRRGNARWYVQLCWISIEGAWNALANNAQDQAEQRMKGSRVW